METEPIKKNKRIKKLVITAIILGIIYIPTYLISGLFYNPYADYGAEGSDTSLLIIPQSFIIPSWVLYGYADTKGKVVIRPQFSEVNPFYDGLAAVKRNGKYGYIDKTGKTVIPFQYIDAGNFHNGIAIVATDVKNITKTIQSYKSFVIDTHGNVIKELGFIRGCSVVGVYSIMNEDGGTVYVDNNFNVIWKLPDNLNDARFHDGLVVVSRRDLQYPDNLEYYLDQFGKQAFPDTFYEAQDFSDGVAAVRYSSSDYWQYIDTKGNVVLKPIYCNAHPFGEGLAWVEDEEWVIIDKLGNQKGTLKKPKGEVILCEPVGSFSDGLCVINIRYYGSDPLRSYYGYVNTSGEWVIEPKFTGASVFKNGIAEVSDNGKLAYINKTGKYIWGPK